jgi:tRNA pseudouridine65 synthase
LESPSKDKISPLAAIQKTPEPQENPRFLECDDHLAWLWKPNHLLVHRTELARHDTTNLKEWVLENTDWTYAQPINRLDRPTSGIVLLARNVEASKLISEQFANHSVQKTYLSIVRGWMDDEGIIEKPIPTSHNAKPKEAITRYKTLARAEIAFPITRYDTSRFSLVECQPLTGRFHQIRLHLKHIKHPIIGDTAHGDKPHNRWFAQNLSQPFLLLHSGVLTIKHPFLGDSKTVRAPLPGHWKETMNQLGWSDWFSIFGSEGSTQSDNV